MAKVQKHSAEQYYERVRTGQERNNAARIMKYMLNYGQDGKTRHELCDRYFCVDDHGKKSALDGGAPLPWQTIASPVIWLRDNGYLVESNYKIPDPVTKNKAKLLFPSHIDPNRLVTPPERYQPSLI